MTRPPKLDWPTTRVVKASRALTPAQKLIWLEIHGLDQGEQGAFIGAKGLGERIGLGTENVEKQRRELVALGLLVTAPRPGRRSASWWPALPEAAEPRSDRPSPAELQAAAAALDRAIEARRLAYSGTPLKTRGKQEPAYHDTPVEQPTGVLESAAATPTGVLQSTCPPPTGVPQYAPEESQTRNLQPLSRSHERSDLEDGGVEEGAVTRDREEDGGPGNWRHLVKRITRRGGDPAPLGALITPHPA